MYVSAQPPPILSLAVPAELSLNQGKQSGQLKLQPYQIVQATVQEGGLDKVVLNLRQHRLKAETRVPLRSGQKLNLQVVSTSPQVHLRIVEEAELRHLFRLLHAFGENIRLMPALQNLEAQGFNLPSGLMGLLGSDPDAIDGNMLSRLWKDLGLNLEALLADGKKPSADSGLKMFLLMHAHQMQAAEDGSGDSTGILEHLRLFQLCRYRLAQENVVFLPLPFDFLEEGYLLAEKEAQDSEQGSGDSQEDGEDIWKLSLNLKLSKLGDLQILMLFEKQELRLRVLCGSREKADIINSALPGLQKRLTSVDMVSFSVDTGAPDPMMHLLGRLVPEGDHFLEASA
ncbi:MAG: flagellar hook-length control protein FliK [Desulfobacteraceae bacterium]|nr:flagellar hook-length control protein FliK [Desulfobacteraceae bacterium]